MVQRESALSPFAVYLDTQDGERAAAGAPEGHTPPLGRFLAGVNGVFFVATQDMRPGLSEASVPLDVAKPTAAEQRAAWAEALGESAAGARSAGSQFSLDSAPAPDRRRRPGGAFAGEGALRGRLWDAAWRTRDRASKACPASRLAGRWGTCAAGAGARAAEKIAPGQAARVVYDEWGFAAKRAAAWASACSSRARAAPQDDGGECSPTSCAEPYRIDLSTWQQVHRRDRAQLRCLFDAGKTAARSVLRRGRALSASAARSRTATTARQSRSTTAAAGGVHRLAILATN